MGKILHNTCTAHNKVANIFLRSQTYRISFACYMEELFLLSITLKFSPIAANCRITRAAFFTLDPFSEILQRDYEAYVKS